MGVGVCGKTLNLAREKREVLQLQTKHRGGGREGMGRWGGLEGRNYGRALTLLD